MGEAGELERGGCELKEVREVIGKGKLNLKAKFRIGKTVARGRAILPVVLALLIPAASVAAQAKRHVPSATTPAAKAAPSSAEGEFFIISSVDLAKHQLLLKRPTEVTEIMDVTDETHFLDEQGRAIQLKDFRAGDTVFVTSRPDQDATPIAMRIQKGEMTVSVLQSRYLSGLEKF
jgi:hypothetical protein